MCGGRLANAAQTTAECYSYDAGSDAWTQEDSMAEERDLFASALLGCDRENSACGTSSEMLLKTRPNTPKLYQSLSKVAGFETRSNVGLTLVSKALLKIGSNPKLCKS